jgi:superfamily II DNA or RNA helicase
MFILAPNKFDSHTQNGNDWLETFELYLDEGQVKTHSDRCGALLSRLEADDKKTLIEYDRHVKTNYKTLRNAFVKIFCKVKRTSQEYNADFLSLVQGDMNLYLYHARLSQLAKKAFPMISARTQETLIRERFISGINNDMIIGQFLPRCQDNGGNIRHS